MKKTKKKILITGGCGYIGSQVAHDLIDQNFDVHTPRGQNYSNELCPCYENTWKENQSQELDKNYDP